MQTIIRCSNCTKELSKGDREFCSKYNVNECTECRFHTSNGTRNIGNYNAWLKGLPDFRDAKYRLVLTDNQ